jgi:hypothetical protein
MKTFRRKKFQSEMSFTLKQQVELSSELVAQISVPWSIVLPWLLKLIAEAAEAAILA